MKFLALAGCVPLFVTALLAQPAPASGPSTTLPHSVADVSATSRGSEPHATMVPPAVHQVVATAPDPFNDPLIAQIVARHEKAVHGDRNETKALTSDLEKWTREQPRNYLLLAYLGSAYTLCSRDAWIGPNKLTFLRKGGQCLEAAVAGDPANPAVRFVRAINYFELPALFGKHRAANEDFQILVQQVEGSRPMAQGLTTPTAQAIFYYAGLSDLQFGMRSQAKDVFQRGLQLDATTALGAKIRSVLSRTK